MHGTSDILSNITRQRAPELLKGMKCKPWLLLSLECQSSSTSRVWHQEPSDGRTFLCQTQQQRRGSAIRSGKALSSSEQSSDRLVCHFWSEAVYWMHKVSYVTYTSWTGWKTSAAVGPKVEISPVRAMKWQEAQLWLRHQSVMIVRAVLLGHSRLYQSKGLVTYPITSC